MHQKKSIKSAKTQGELPDKNGKPSGVHWKFNKEDERPWGEFSHDITKVKIEGSVHPVSMKECWALETVPETLPRHLKNVSRMFLGCSGIKKLGKNVKISEHTDAYKMFYLLKKQHSVKTYAEPSRLQTSSDDSLIF